MSEVKGLLVMDVDSTLVQEEVIDLLGEEAGVGLISESHILII